MFIGGSFMTMGKLGYYTYRLLQLSTDVRDTDESKHEAEPICYPGFKCLALLWRRAVRHYRPFEAFHGMTEPDFSPICWARLLTTKTRRFLNAVCKSTKKRNTRANYAFKKSIRIRSASRPFQAYVFIRCSLKTVHFITGTHACTDKGIRLANYW